MGAIGVNAKEQSVAGRSTNVARRIVAAVGIVLSLPTRTPAQTDLLRGKTIEFSHQFAHCANGQNTMQQPTPGSRPRFSGKIYISKKSNVYFFYYDAPDAGIFAVLNAGPTTGYSIRSNPDTKEKGRVPVVAEAKFDGRDFAFSYSFTVSAPYGRYRSFDEESTSVHFIINSDMTCSISGSTEDIKVTIEHLLLWRGYTCGPEVVEGHCQIRDN
jgi:hypothetical protein